jgi:hypothetical protein
VFVVYDECDAFLSRGAHTPIRYRFFFDVPLPCTGLTDDQDLMMGRWSEGGVEYERLTQYWASRDESLSYSHVWPWDDIVDPEVRDQLYRAYCPSYGAHWDPACHEEGADNPWDTGD